MHHKLQLLIRICFLLDYRLLFLRSLLLCWTCVFWWKRYSTKNIVALILKYLAEQTNTYSKSAAETLKANSRGWASLLTTCSMSKTLFKCFLVFYEHVFVYCDVLVATISFSMYLLSILNRFHTLIYFYLLWVLYWVQKKPPEVSFKKGVL